MNTDNISKGLNTLFDNKTFSTSMSLLLALYAGAAAPALPNNVIVFFLGENKPHIAFELLKKRNI